MKINIENNIDEIFDRWIEKVYPSKRELKKALFDRRLTIYYGVDPTAPHLHLGHSTNLFVLKAFQKLGHKIVLLIGDFTAQIGDPTGKESCRKPLTKEEVLLNCKNYKKQAGKILDFFLKENPAEIKFNSEWLNKISSRELICLAANFTHGQMIKRNMFQERIKRGKEIYLHEFLYPLFQAYDSVALNCDIEVGGIDQTFNMLRGRDLLRIYRKKEKFVVCTPLLINPKTQKKLMSKTENFIGIGFPPNEMYGKIMAIPDEVIIQCFKLCTEIPLSEISKIKSWHPRKAKAMLAEEIVKLYHGESEAKKARENFERVFKEKKTPAEIKVFKIEKKKIPLSELLTLSGLVTSKSEAKRLILQGGVKINGKKKSNWREIIEIKKNFIIQVGKKSFLKIKPAR